MKVKTDILINHIQKARVNGLIDEAVFDSDMKFCVTDMAKSILSICKKGIGKNEFGEIGIFNLTLFLKAIEYAKTSIFQNSESLEFFIEENRLVFRKEGNELKYLLSNLKVISSTVLGIDKTLEKVRGKEGICIKVKRAEIESCLNAITLITPEKVSFYVENEKVFCLVGKTTEHNSIICLGQIDKKIDVKVEIKPDLLSSILSTVPIDEEISFEIRNGYPILIECEKYIFVIAPIAKE